MNRIYIWLVFAVALLTSCDNQDNDFPDFDYQTVYFANPYYIRTLILGNDLFSDNSKDNEHKFEIKATMGGVYSNNKNRIIDFTVDESLCENLYFSDGNPVILMPSAYYRLSSNQITIPSGKTMGGVEVQLTDAFFEDPKSLVNTYVIPLVMNNVQGADSILQGKPQVDNPDRCVNGDWTVLPQDFVLCGVKYINPWHANYLRRGIDQITNDNGSSINIRHEQYVERDEEVYIHTNSLTQSTLPITIQDSNGKSIILNLFLSFDGEGSCTVSGDTDSYEITGSGKFISKGEKNSMGGKDRDALYLDYNVDFKDQNLKYATKDTLVVKGRGVIPEYFTVVRK